MSEFDDAAPYHATYRPGIPGAAVRLLGQTVAAKQHPILLDLGTGTGQVPAALHEAFAQIDAVERDPGMLAEANKTLTGLPDTTVRLHNTPTEEFVPPHAEWAADKVTVCRAFHWMDQPRTAPRVRPSFTSPNPTPCRLRS
ncbi:methyltransferase domain-containing protein [Streptomyces sp. NPDC048251]|uniref:methyltransferase domain-containing protein n=1 Tax=Streptomyces sp. NPDC048251 TaxID=3154501 RepID=UPI003433E146